MLTREQILSRKPRRLVVDVPEWGGEVIIQAMSVGAAQSLSEQDSIVDTVIASCVNEDGSPLFSPEDKDTLRRTLSLSSCKLIADAALTLNGATKAAVEDMAKNSGTGPNGASPSA